MKNSFIELVKSRRFILIVLATLTWVVNQPNIDTHTVLTALTSALGAVVSVGTLDSVAKKIGNK